MVEKWTAADETLYRDLEARRAAVRGDWRDRVFVVAKKFNNSSHMDAVFATDNLIKHAVEVSAALEPFVLIAQENNNEA